MWGFSVLGFSPPCVGERERQRQRQRQRQRGRELQKREEKTSRKFLEPREGPEASLQERRRWCLAGVRASPTPEGGPDVETGAHGLPVACGAGSHTPPPPRGLISWGEPFQTWPDHRLAVSLPERPPGGSLRPGRSSPGPATHLGSAYFHRRMRAANWMRYWKSHLDRCKKM